MTTKSTKKEEIIRAWHLIDAKDQILGRISTDIALKLVGKNKPYFVRNLDCGDNVVVINAKYVKLTGKKESSKVYNRHSGYPGGFKSEPIEKVRREKPERIIWHAVKGMLPNNKLRDRLITRLFIFNEDKHDFTNKFT